MLGVFLLIPARQPLQLLVASDKLTLLLGVVLLAFLVLLGEGTQLPHELTVQHLQFLQPLCTHCLLGAQLAVEIGIGLFQLCDCPL